MSSARGRVSGSVHDVRLEQASARDWAQSAGDAWLDAASMWKHMSENTNQPRAATGVDWDRVCAGAATVLDLGCGSGWLTAMLSRREDVERVIAWDSSPRLLGEVLPETLRLLDGEPAKVEPVCGAFVPLLLDDASVNLVVMGSAFHHCAEPETLLDEFRRVLTDDGRVLLLNETPWRVAGMLWFGAMMGIAHLGRLLVGAGPDRPGALAADHVLYDPTLGDRAYTLRAWHALFDRTGWRAQTIRTGLLSYPARFRRRSPFEPELTHFLLEPA